MCPRALAVSRQHLPLSFKSILVCINYNKYEYNIISVGPPVFHDFGHICAI